MNLSAFKKHQKERNKAIKDLPALYEYLPVTLPLLLVAERKIQISNADFIDYFSEVTKEKNNTVRNHMNDLNTLNSLNRLATVDKIKPYEKRYSDYITSLGLPDDCLERVVEAFHSLAPKLKLKVPTKILSYKDYTESKYL